MAVEEDGRTIAGIASGLQERRRYVGDELASPTYLLLEYSS